MQPWIDLFRSLGDSLLEVWRAELATLQEDLSRSGRNLGVALGIFGAAAVLLFWIVGLLLFVLVSLLHVWVPWWAASLIVLALFVITAAILACFGTQTHAAGWRTPWRPCGSGWTATRLVAARPARPSEDAGRRAGRGGRWRRPGEGTAMNDRLEEARRAAEQRLEESRRQAELRLSEVRTAVKPRSECCPGGSTC